MIWRGAEIVMRTNRGRRAGPLAIFLCASLTGCGEAPQTNAAEEARIARGMDEVAADQARSEINVAEVRAREDNLSEGEE